MNEENAKNSIKASVGLRYDNEELVAAQIGATYYFGNKLNKTLDLTLRLGKRTMGKLAWNMMPKPNYKIGLSYEIWHEDIDLYRGKHRSDNLKFIYQKANATLLSFDALNLNVDLGIAWEHYHHYDYMANPYSISYFKPNDYYFNYHARAQYNSEDHWYFTHKGMRAEARYAYYTDNFAQWKGHAGFSEVSARWRVTFPLTSTTHLQPTIYGRLLFGKDIPSQAMNMMGGNRDGIYYASPLDTADPGFLRIHQPTTCLPMDQLLQKTWIKTVLLEREVDALALMRAYLKEKGYDKRLALVEGTTDVVKIGKYQELLPQDVNKGTGVDALRQLPVYAGRTLIAVGDYWNDMELLEAADIACCPANAIPEVKAVCAHILPSHNDDPMVALIRDVIPAL